MTVVEVAAERNILPIASSRATWRHVVGLFRQERAFFSLVIGLQIVASAAGLVGPRILEVVIDDAGPHRGNSTIEIAALLFAVRARRPDRSHRRHPRARGGSGRAPLARLREKLIQSVLNLPLGLVERAGTGDLLTRASTDVDDLSQAVRAGLPQLLVAAVTAVLAIIALVLTAPVLALALVPSIPIIAIGTRWYLKQARPAYQHEAASFARVNAGIQETVAAGRTIEAFGLGPARVAQDRLGHKGLGGLGAADPVAQDRVLRFERGELRDAARALHDRRWPASHRRSPERRRRRGFGPLRPAASGADRHAARLAGRGPARFGIAVARRRGERGTSGTDDRPDAGRQSPRGIGRPLRVPRGS